MATLLTAIQFYPAINKLFTDFSGYMSGSDPATRERIMQHKLDETREQLVELKRLIEYRRPVMCDVSTQTDEPLAISIPIDDVIPVYPVER